MNRGASRRQELLLFGQPKLAGIQLRLQRWSQSSHAFALPLAFPSFPIRRIPELGSGKRARCLRVANSGAEDGATSLDCFPCPPLLPFGEPQFLRIVATQAFFDYSNACIQILRPQDCAFFWVSCIGHQGSWWSRSFRARSDITYAGGLSVERVGLNSWPVSWIALVLDFVLRK